MKVAQMPWDPAPVNIIPGPSAPNAIAASSNGSIPKTEIKQEIVIKQEPKYETDLSQYPQAGGLNPQAADRAAALLTQRFGSHATASIQAAGLPQPRLLTLPGQRPQGLQLPGQHVHPQGHIAQNLADAQMDGGNQWAAAVEESRSARGRETIDRIFASAALEKEAGPSTATNQEVSEVTFSSLSLHQLDGDNNFDDDEDAINSDLDDDDDEENQAIADDGQSGEMILCLWDKVNRVKSKV
jgi:transcription initiation factor TFIIA large subunit